MRLPVLPSALGLLSALLPAQGAVPPLQLLQTNPLPGFSTVVVPGSSVEQIGFVHLPGDPPNLYYCTLTVNGLIGFGAAGGRDLLAGSYDVLTDTFTPNSEAAALNTTGFEFGMQVHHTGLFAVFDRISGPPHLASRAAVGQPWVYVGPINQVATLSGSDPALADFHGQTWLLFILGTDIVMAPIDLTTGNLTGPTQVVVRAAVSGSTANSPTPILDANNQLIGLSHHDVLGSDNDHYMSLDLDPNTPSVLMNDTTTWTNNGDFIGGRFFDVESTTPYHVFSIDTFWCPGGRAAVGTSMPVDFYSPPTTGNELYLSALLVNIGFLPAPVAVPGIQGQLGLNPLGATWFGLFLHDNTRGRASTSFAIPNLAALRGLVLPAQGATLEALNTSIAFSSTAALTIE